MDLDLQICVLEVTNRCNLRCPHCASDSGTSRAEEMSREELQGVFKDLKGLGCRKVTILGGEFLLRKDWYDICVDVKSAGMNLTLISNGQLITDGVIEQFMALNPDVVGISLDGATPETYRKQRGVDGFAKCMEVIRAMQKRGIRQVSAITTFSSLNIGEFDQFANLFIDTDIVWQVQMVHKAGHRFDDSLLLSSEQYQFLVEKMTHYLYDYNERLKMISMDDFGYFPMTPKLRFIHQIWRGCSAGIRGIGIRSNGDVLGCLSLGDDFIEANLRRTPLPEIWNSGRFFQRFRNKKAELTGYCKKCPMSEKCLAGCSAMAISTTGHLGDNKNCIRRIEEEQILALLDDEE